MNTAPSFLRVVFLLLAALVLPASAIIDVNENGMSDLWECLYNNGELFDPQNPDHHPNADPDGDGWTNLEEAIAGTDPFDANSADGMVRLTVQASPRFEGVSQFSWPSIEGKLYYLSCSDDLKNWVHDPTPILGTGEPIELGMEVRYEYEEEEILPRRLFWRVKVEDSSPDHEQLTAWERHILSLPDTDGDGLPDIIDPNPAENQAVIDPDGSNPPPGSETNVLGFWDFETLELHNGIPRIFPERSGNTNLQAVAAGLAETSPLGVPAQAARIGPVPISLKGEILKQANGSQYPNYSFTMWFKIGKDAIKSTTNEQYFVVYAVYNVVGSSYINSAGNGLFIRRKLDATPHEQWMFGGFHRNTWEGGSSSGGIGISFNRADGATDDGKWHHLAVVHAGTNATIYLDGDELWSGSLIGKTYNPPLNVNTRITFGALYPSYNLSRRFPEAYLDRLRLQSRALTAAEVLGYYRQDIDGDGLWDITEVRTRNEQGEFLADPYYWDHPNSDHDRDGASSLLEQEVGSDIALMSTAGDGIPDGWKIEHGLDVHDEDLADADEDGDGLTTRQEWQYDTDPDKADTDGDGTSDGAEIAQGSNPNDASDNGQAPDDPIEEVEFKSGGDYAVWEMQITGKGPRDTRSFRFLSRPADQERGPVGYSDPHTFKLWKNNSYEITYKLRGGEKDWFCWAGAVDGKPDIASYTQEPEYQIGVHNPDADFFIIKDHWVVDNRDGLLTSHLHSKYNDKASSLKTTLIPIGFKTYPDSEPGPYKPHLINLKTKQNEHAIYTSYGKCVSHVWNSQWIDLTDYLIGADDFELRMFYKNNLDWKSNESPVNHELNWVGEPPDNGISYYLITALLKNTNIVVDSLYLTVVPRSTKQSYDNWYNSEVVDTSWLAELPPMFSWIETTPEPSGYLPRPDRNFNPFFYAIPDEIDTRLHPDAYFEQRSYATPGGHGHQVCYDSSGVLIETGVSAGTADKAAPFPANLNPLPHLEQDVKPYLWALHLDGNPTLKDGLTLDRPIMHEGVYTHRYLEVRPTIPNDKPMLEPGATP